MVEFTTVYGMKCSNRSKKLGKKSFFFQGENCILLLIYGHCRSTGSQLNWFINLTQDSRGRELQASSRQQTAQVSTIFTWDKQQRAWQQHPLVHQVLQWVHLNWSRDHNRSVCKAELAEMRTRLPADWVQRDMQGMFAMKINWLFFLCHCSNFSYHDLVGTIFPFTLRLSGLFTNCFPVLLFPLMEAHQPRCLL